MGSNVRLAASVAAVGFIVLAFGVFRASSAVPFISDCCGCGSLLAPDFTQATPAGTPPEADIGSWFVVEDCQVVFADRTREVLIEVVSGAVLLGAGLGSLREPGRGTTTPRDGEAVRRRRNSSGGPSAEGEC